MDTVDPKHFRQSMGQFVTGVTVVTAGHAGGLLKSSGDPDLHGMTCNSFSSVSSHPPQISVCLTSATRTAKLVELSRAFAVNVLHAEQTALADRFAGRHKEFESDRFDGVPWHAGIAGAPLLDGAKAHLECRLVHAVVLEDHTLIIGRVVRALFDHDVAPLVFYHSAYHQL